MSDNDFYALAVALGIVAYLVCEYGPQYLKYRLARLKLLTRKDKDVKEA